MYPQFLIYIFFMKNFKNTKEGCFNAASTCEYKWEFKEKFVSEYRYSYKNGFFHEICEKYNLKDLPKIK